MVAPFDIQSGGGGLNLVPFWFPCVFRWAASIRELLQSTQMLGCTEVG